MNYGRKIENNRDMFLRFFNMYGVEIDESNFCQGVEDDILTFRHNLRDYTIEYESDRDVYTVKHLSHCLNPTKKNAYHIQKRWGFLPKSKKRKDEELIITDTIRGLAEWVSNMHTHKKKDVKNVKKLDYRGRMFSKLREEEERLKKKYGK